MSKISTQRYAPCALHEKLKRIRKLWPETIQSLFAPSNLLPLQSIESISLVDYLSTLSTLLDLVRTVYSIYYSIPYKVVNYLQYPRPLPI